MRSLIRTRLSVMMFLEYFVWSAWGVSIGTYMAKSLTLDSAIQGWVFSTTAIGAMVAPLFVGFLADRFFSTERVLAVLHILGGAALCVAGTCTKEQGSLFLAIMVFNGLCYMPTLALTNALAFRNIADSAKDFPIIRVFGTIGWIVAAVIVGVSLGEKLPYFFYLGGGVGILLGLYCLTLPHTPPKPAEAGNQDVFGLKALALLKEPSFAIFIVCAFLVCFTLSAYWVGANLFLTEIAAPAPTALQSLGQFSEIFFMAALPFFIRSLGFKRVLLVGILSWVARYLLFASLNFPLIIVGLLLHGVAYDFFFVAAYIYVDKRAPKDLRASAQSFITFVMLGLGMFFGMQAATMVRDAAPFRARIVAMPANTADTSEPVDAAPLPTWSDPKAEDSVFRFLDLTGTIKSLAASPDEQGTEKPADLGSTVDADSDGVITVAELAAIPDDGVTIGGHVYSRKDLTAVFEKIAEDAAGEKLETVEVPRRQYLAAQARNWPMVWMLPSGLAVVTGILFVFGFRDGRVEETADQDATGVDAS